MFVEDIDLTLAVTCDGTAHEVPGAQVKSLSIDLRGYGYEAELTFWISADEKKDTFLPFYTTPKLLTVLLKIGAHNKPEGKAPELLTLAGLVTQKRMFEETYESMEGRPVVFRRYWMRFADPAAVIWKQHYPSELTADATVKARIDAHKGTHIKITYDLPAVDVQHRFVFLGLGAGDAPASFYDFVQWYAAQENAVFEYASYTNEYKLAKEKNATGNAGEMPRQDVDMVEVIFPETPRHNVRLYNAVAEGAKTTDVEQASSATGVRRDILVRKAVAADFDALATLETAKLLVPEHEVEVVFARFPTVTCRPGGYIAFSHAAFSDELFVKKNIYRVRHMTLTLNAVDPRHTADLHMPFSTYYVDCVARLERKEEKLIDRPAFSAPHWPHRLEGLVVSTQGAEADETYESFQDSKTKADEYQVEVPVFAKAKIPVPYHPNGLPGHFYFPHIKASRVLLAVSLHEAEIVRVLEWRERVRLPLETQGNHLLLGKTEKSQTTLSHVYKDEKPVLQLKRLLEKDTEVLQLEEGILYLETKEEA